MTVRTRLTALAFAIGAAAHAAGVVLFANGIRWYGPEYPWWRHVVMFALDLAIVWVALRRTSWLAVALVAFGTEQLVVNGLQPTGIAVFLAATLAAFTSNSRAATFRS